MKKRVILGMVLCLLSLSSCGPDSDSAGQPEPTPSNTVLSAKYPATDAGFEDLVRDARSDQAADLIRSLRPTTVDYNTLFDKSLAVTAEKKYAPLWANPPAALEAKPKQTEIEFWKTTTDDIKAWTPDASAHFGSYEEIRMHLKPGVTIYRWKYLEPGKQFGMAYNGMAYLNGHWAFFPKPGRLVEQPS